MRYCFGALVLSWAFSLPASAEKSSEQVHFETLLNEAHKNLPECDRDFLTAVSRLETSSPGNTAYFQNSEDVQRALDLLESHAVPATNYGNDIAEVFVRQYKRLNAVEVFGALLTESCDAVTPINLLLRLIGTNQQKPLSPKDRQRLAVLVNQAIRRSPRGPDLWDLGMQVKLLRLADDAELVQLNSTQERDLGQLERELRNRYQDHLAAQTEVQQDYDRRAKQEPRGITKLFNLEVAQVTLAKNFAARLKSILRDVTTAASCEHAEATTIATRELVTRAVREMFFEHNVDAVDRYLADAFIQNQPGIPIGKRAFKNYLRSLFTAFPDYSGKIDSLVVDGNLAALQLTWTGTHRGSFLGVRPTGKRITRRTADTYRIENGRIVEHWGVVDQVDMLQTLGLLTSP